MGIVLGYRACSGASDPKNMIAGIITSQENTPPESVMAEIRSPMM